MEEWIGKIRKVPKFKTEGYLTEEIVDIGDTWVEIKTTEKDFVYQEKHEHKTNKDLTDILIRLKYK